jgi:hypothetical protein
MNRYFAQADMDNNMYALYRYKYENDLIIEEEWNPNTSSWGMTSNLTRLFVGGDCTLMEIQEETAMKAFPVAFAA